MSVHQFILKSRLLNFSVISVFIIRTASVILNSSITTKIFGLVYYKPEFAYLPRKASTQAKRGDPTPPLPFPDTGFSPLHPLREFLGKRPGEWLRSGCLKKDYPVRVGKFYSNKLREKNEPITKA